MVVVWCSSVCVCVCAYCVGGSCMCFTYDAPCWRSVKYGLCDTDKPSNSPLTRNAPCSHTHHSNSMSPTSHRFTPLHHPLPLFMFSQQANESVIWVRRIGKPQLLNLFLVVLQYQPSCGAQWRRVGKPQETSVINRPFHHKTNSAESGLWGWDQSLCIAPISAITLIAKNKDRCEGKS